MFGPFSWLRLKMQTRKPKTLPPNNFVDIYFNFDTGKIHAINPVGNGVAFDASGGVSLSSDNTWTGTNIFDLPGTKGFHVTTFNGNIEFGTTGTGQTIISSATTGAIENMSVGANQPAVGNFTAVLVSNGGTISGAGGATAIEGSTNPVWDMRRLTPATSSVAATSALTGVSSGDAADGFGPILQFRISDTAASNSLIGALGFVRAGADNTGDLVIRPQVAGSAQERFRFTSAGAIVGVEGSAAAPAANGWAIFGQDNGAGKTQLMVRFATGAAVQIAIEP